MSLEDKKFEISIVQGRMSIELQCTLKTRMVISACYPFTRAPEPRRNGTFKEPPNTAPIMSDRTANRPPLKSDFTVDSGAEDAAGAGFTTSASVDSFCSARGTITTAFPELLRAGRADISDGTVVFAACSHDVDVAMAKNLSEQMSVWPPKFLRPQQCT